MVCKVWAPYYTLHKIMAGLFDLNQHLGNTQAMAVLKKMATFISKRIEALVRAKGCEQRKRVILCLWNSRLLVDGFTSSMVGDGASTVTHHYDSSL